jgi:hypothetical protein
MRMTPRGAFSLLAIRTPLLVGRPYKSAATPIVMRWILPALLCVGAAPAAGDLPEDELQVQINSYTDNFGLSVWMPVVSVSKRVSPQSSISGRMLVDAVTSASMRSRFEIDGITSASRKASGGGSGLDELRTEFGVGARHLLGNQTLALDVLRSDEHDYSSTTIAFAATHPFALNNTEFQWSVLHSWDRVFPTTRDWRRHRDVTTLSATLTQTLHRRAIGQAELAYSDLDGMLTDVYQVVTITDPGRLEAKLYEPRHPDRRQRKAAGLRAIWKLSASSALEVEYRHYWDDWEVRSETIHGRLRRHAFSDRVTMELGVRGYTQGRAYFFKPTYSEPEPYMSVDAKLDSGHSMEYEFQTTVPGGWVLPGVDGDADETMQLTGYVRYYHRHTSSPDWHSRRRDLDAVLFGLGFQWKF